MTRHRNLHNLHTDSFLQPCTGKMAPTLKYASDNMRAYVQDCIKEHRARNDDALNADNLVEDYVRMQMQLEQVKQELVNVKQELAAVHQEVKSFWKQPLRHVTHVNSKHAGDIEIGQALASAYMRSQASMNIILQINAKVDKTRIDIQEKLNEFEQREQPDEPPRPASPAPYDWKLPASMIENEYSES